MKWKKWFSIQDCENNFPTGLTEFQKVIITKLLREDRLESSIIRFVEGTIGGIDTLAPALELEKVYSDQSAPVTPVLFITSPGSDPSN